MNVIDAMNDYRVQATLVMKGVNNTEYTVNCDGLVCQVLDENTMYMADDIDSAMTDCADLSNVCETYIFLYSKDYKVRVQLPFVDESDWLRYADNDLEDFLADYPEMKPLFN